MKKRKLKSHHPRYLWKITQTHSRKTLSGSPHYGPFVLTTKRFHLNKMKKNLSFLSLKAATVVCFVRLFETSEKKYSSCKTFFNVSSFFNSWKRNKALLFLHNKINWLYLRRQKTYNDQQHIIYDHHPSRLLRFLPWSKILTISSAVLPSPLPFRLSCETEREWFKVNLNI